MIKLIIRRLIYFMKKRFSRIALVMLVLMLSLPLFADGKIAVWQWQLDDPEVTAFRYQLNSDDPAGWTYVSADVDTYEYPITDPTQELTLYLQRSYDGLNWSQTTASSVIVEEPAPVVESAEDVAVIGPVEPVAVSTGLTRRFEPSVLLKVGVGSRIGSPFFESGASKLRFDLGLALDFANIVSVTDNFGIGLRADVAANFVPASSWNDTFKSNFFKNIDFDLSADLKVMLQYEGGPVAAYLGFGAGYSIFNQAGTLEALATHTLKQYKLFGYTFDSAWFLSGIVGGRYYVTDAFSIGLEVYGRYMFPAKKLITSADLVLGVTF